MKLNIISILVILCISILNYNCVYGVYDIGIDRSNYIRKQLEIRSNEVNDQITIFQKDINKVFEDKYGGLFFGLTSIMNSLSGLFGILELAVPCGGAAILSSAVLGVAQNAVSGTGGDIGATISNGVKALIDESISEYNALNLASFISSEKDIIRTYYTVDIKYSDSLTQAKDVHRTFIKNNAHFKKEGYELDSISLLTLHANSHLLFLSDIIVSGESLYRIPNANMTYFIDEFNYYINDYRKWIDLTDQLGIAHLNQRISDKGYKHQDEWNLRNDYYNFMKLYVYDISNYWDYLRADLFPKGMFIENAHVSLSNLFGTPYKGDDHMTGTEIQSFINSKNPYQYQGNFKGFYYKNRQCKITDKNGNMHTTSLTKYFGGRQYFFREGVERDTFFLGDEGELAGPRQYADFSRVPMYSVNQFNSRDNDPYRAKDYFWGLGVTNGVTQFDVGNVNYYSKKIEILFPGKSAALALPISYNLCRTGCGYENGNDIDTLLVEGAVVGFVNSDVKDTNTVFELTGTMIDAQKYNYITSNDGVYYSRDGYKLYKHAMFFPANTRITYNVDYNPYNGSPGTFKFYIDFKTSVTSNLNVKVYKSSSSIECIQLAAQTDVEVLSTGQLAYIGEVTLDPINHSTNFITLQFSHPVFLNHISFYSTE